MRYGFEEDPDDEGRICALEFDSLLVRERLHPQRPARADPARLPHGLGRRLSLPSCAGLSAEKPVVTCGDFNVAHNEIDLKNPGPNRGNAGFTDEERAKFTDAAGRPASPTPSATCTPMRPGPTAGGATRFNARKNNAGWRIDYFLVSDAIADRRSRDAPHPAPTSTAATTAPYELDIET